VKLIRVAFQGERGAFGEDAIVRFFGSNGVVTAPEIGFAEVVAAVAEGRADYGVLPVENTIAGIVVEAERALAESSVRTIGEVSVPVDQCLLVVPGAQLSDVRQVRSHPVALAQCSRFLSAHKQMEVVPSSDTAGAAREVSSAGDRSVAAIAGRRAAKIYALDILKEGIQDRADNETRFLIIAQTI
jgi:prephenate dehydratase/chorismate mutase/prephenate dehydratase